TAIKSWAASDVDKRQPEYREEFADLYAYRFWDYELEDYDRSRLSNICDSNYEGRYIYYTFDSRYLYYIIDFDDLCDFSTHCFKVMKYDTETAEIKELYSYSGIDYRFLNLKMAINNGDVYMSYDKYSYSDNERVSEISMIKNGKLEKILDDSSTRTILELTNCDTDKLILSSYKSWFDENDKYHASGQLYEYNSGKVNEIYSVDYDDGHIDIVFPPMRYRNEFLSVDRDENNIISVYSDNFRLNTGLKGATLTSASDKTISFIVKDIVSCFMYVYNFDTMERYELNVKGLTDEWGVTPIGDNFILSNGGRTHVFLIPEIGATFLLKSFDASYPVDTDGKRVWIIDSETGSIHSDGNGSIATNKPSMLYVIEPQ
ncbi:MAG: hypothetical protein K2J37_08305, partial [Ruminococcus sp.]|nr:hypothetical protein [Ruminococcus sp.]